MTKPGMPESGFARKTCAIDASCRRTRYCVVSDRCSLRRVPGVAYIFRGIFVFECAHLATTVEIICEVNLVKKSCFQFGVLDCLIGLNRSGVFSI